jgi:hypothetical protein
MVFEWLAARRRRKILRHPFPDAWEEVLSQNVAHYGALGGLESREALARWIDVCGRAFGDLRSQVNQGNQTFLDEYGATSIIRTRIRTRRRAPECRRLIIRDCSAGTGAGSGRRPATWLPPHHDSRAG